MLKKLLNAIPSSIKKKYIYFQILLLTSALFEVASLYMIGPFFSYALTQDDTINPVVAALVNVSPFENTLEIAGIICLLLLITSNVIAYLTTLYSARFAHFIGKTLTCNLLKYYLLKDYLFFKSQHKSLLMKNIMQESATRLLFSVLVPFMQLNTRGYVILLIGVSIFAMNPMLTSLAAVVLLGVYYSMYLIIKPILARNGQKISKYHAKRYKNTQDMFGAIKEVKYLGKEAMFYQEFEKFSNKLAYYVSTNMTIGLTPKYAIETIIFVCIISSIIYMNSQNTLTQYLPAVSVCVLLIYRLLPSLQQVFTSTAQIKGDMHCIETIADELSIAKAQSLEPRTKAHIQFNKELSFQNITFSYPTKTALKNVSFLINKGDYVAFLGPSGAGKSTIIDIIMGLLFPTQGDYLIDNIEIDRSNIAKLQNTIGYVTQSPFLIEASLAENIALGENHDQIDYKLLDTVLKQTKLIDLARELPDGIHSSIGENGCLLSGGQCQRIAIARALYRQPEILVLDEATNALDEETEQVIMDTIYQLKGKCTVIMITHKFDLVKNFDKKYLVDNKTVKLLDNETTCNLLEELA